jgi:hypothetical protein
MKIVRPENCHLWNKPGLSNEDLRFRIVQVFSQDSHASRKLLECEECGQAYYCSFDEQIDWVNGNDAQYWYYIPIQPDRETIETLEALSHLHLTQLSPMLIKGWGPEDEELRFQWIRG